MHVLRPYGAPRVAAFTRLAFVSQATSTRRCFSNSISRGSVSYGGKTELGTLDPSKLTVTRTFSPKPLVSPDKLEFGRSFTDHILSIEWTATEGWLPPRISPYQGLVMDPAAAVLHYAYTCFEGMKAYKDSQGRARLFRPDKNMQRLNSSAARISLPTFDEDAMIKLLTEYVRLESSWIPAGRGPSLYLRPTMIGTDASISVSRPRSALLYVIASPMSSYFKGKGGSSMHAISLKATSSPVRAWPGGVGDKKLGGNYAPSIVPQEEAVAEGFHQNLWLLGDPTNPEDQFVTEAGTMNLFVAWTSPVNGKRELVTPPLDGVILPGVTRDSILELARERLEPRGWVVSERPIRMIDIQRASQQGHLLEMFGAGTAAVVNPVRNVYWQGELIDCGLKENEDAGPLTMLMKDWIEDIQYGVEKHPWSIVV